MIHNDFSSWEDSGLPLRNMRLIKDLRSFEKSTQTRLAELEKDPESNKTLILQEKATLAATQIEMLRVQRESLYSQFLQ